MMPEDGPLGIMGGAFDPVHIGHLRTACELQEALNLAEIRLIPSSNPPHRPAHIAQADERLRMLEAAVHDLAWCRVDDRELKRDGPSWTVVTLEELRAECGDRSLCMILGMDAFLMLPDWYRWQEVLRLAHIVVAHRPGWSPPVDGPLGDLINNCLTDNAADLRSQPSGLIHIQEVTQLEISSSGIRKIVSSGNDARYLVPDSVLEIVQQIGCYAADRRG